MRSGDPLISMADERKRERIVTREEELRLLTACENRYQKHLRPILICALDIGMRRGGLCPKESVPLSPQSGQLKIAQRFIAGIGRNRAKSVKRTAEKVRGSDDYHSAVRFTDYKSLRSYPSSKLLG